MKAMLLVSVVGLLLVTVYANPSCKECGKNEEWTECGTACPKTCDNPEPQICTLQCVVGCQCKAGFLLNKKGHCVRPEDCKKCGKNEEWTECGTACPKTCDKPEPQACTKQCVIGCQCKDGFVLNKKGRCVRPSHCCDSN